MFSAPLHVTRSIRVKARLDQAYDLVSSFKTWPHWSPWLCQEPTCKVESSGEAGEIGQQQFWEGDLIGAGKMKLVAVDPNSSLTFDLNFLKPWKSFAKIDFTFDQKGEDVEITWKMASSLPIFFWPIRKKWEAWIGADYERGLLMMKELLEDAKVTSQVRHRQIEAHGGFYYVGIRQSFEFESLKEKTAEAFAELEEQVTSGVLGRPDLRLSFLHKWDPVHRLSDCTCAYGYRDQPDEIDDSRFIQGQVPDHRSIVVQHLGAWHYLGNAWSAAMNFQRGNKLKLSKKIPEYEIYENTPDQTPIEELSTAIHLPLK